MQKTNEAALRRFEEIDVTIEKVAFEGKAVAHIDDLVLFVEGAVPGDRVRVRIRKKKKNYAEGKMIEIIEPSPQRVNPPCAHFGVCGGCTWQHLNYDQQLYWKREHVRDAFLHIGGFTDVDVHETLPAPNIFYYRNKMEYTFGERRWRLPEEMDLPDADTAQFAVGLHVAARHDKILHIDACWLQSEQSNAILNFTRAFFLEKGLSVYSTKTSSGDLRHLVIREAKQTGESMVYLITTDTAPAIIDEYAQRLKEYFPQLTTFVHGITTHKAMVAQSDKERVVFGPGIIHERLHSCTYEISPSSFFQSNTVQAECLYDVVRDYAGFTPDNIVWDLYCGIGTIALSISEHVLGVIGVESHIDAVRDAQRNAGRNGITNCTFICEDILRFIQMGAQEKTIFPHVIILDPPRSGLHPEVAKGISKLGMNRIVYVSCNPATCARDVKILASFGYQIDEIQPVDMFPHTYHIECVVKLTRKSVHELSTHHHSWTRVDDVGVSTRPSTCNDNLSVSWIPKII